MSVRTPDQRALIHFEDGIQRLVIETAFAAEGTNFAWVVPLPSEPKIEAVSTNFFPDLSRTFQARLVYQPSYAWVAMLVGGWVVGRTIWVYRNRRGLDFFLWNLFIVLAVVLAGMFLPALSKAGVGSVSASQPRVLQRAQVGLFDTVVLKGADGGELLNWLNGNGFHVPAEALDVISTYASNHWFFAAARLNAPVDRKAVSRPHPLAFTFATERAIYPLRLTGIENGSCEIELFVFGETRASARHFQTEFCGVPLEIAKEDLPDTRLTAFSPPRPGEFRIATDELKKFALPAAVVTKLSGKLSPADMRKDAEIAWVEYSPRVPTRYSREAALTRSLNWGVGIFVAGSLLFYAMGASGRIEMRKRVTAVSIVALIAAVAHYAFAEIVPVRTVKTKGWPISFFKILDLALWIYEQDNPEKGPITFGRLEKDFAYSRVVNAFTREPIREEATPGNITLHPTTTNTVVRWYDINGVGHDLITIGDGILKPR